MQHGILGSLSLLDASGYVIIAVILATLFTTIGLNFYIRGRYADLEHDLQQHRHHDELFSNRVLNRILEDARIAARRPGADEGYQALVEHHVQRELGGLLLGERFVRAAVGLVIILGLAGTFYGLSLSIGKLVRLVAGGSSDLADVTLALTQGLTQALAGMSVAFTASLFGISTAVVLTVFGIFFNVTDRRTAVMLAIETHLSRVLGAESAAAHGGGRDAELAQIVAQFGDAVIVLGSSVGQFQSALEGFSNNTRDFQEFNLHLKDNVQRMSLGFADLSDTLKTQLAELRGRSPRQGA